MIPRMPHAMEAISDHIMAFAASLGLECHRDGLCNVLVRKNASPGYEGSPPVMVQAHMDMICEKHPGVAHDFARDPLRLVREGDLLRADGTTLGADNGLGMAYIMALLEDAKAPHPPLEGLFTANEETDMSGALGLDYSRIRSRLVVSLDAAALRVCGSGELEMEIRLEKKLVPARHGCVPLVLGVEGLRGGHSGQNAMAERGNAIVLLNRLLLALDKAAVAYRIADMRGGAGMSSAFARDASCVIVCSPDDRPAVEAAAAAQQALYARELAKRDPGVRVTLRPHAGPVREVLSGNAALRLKRLLAILPDGVFSLNRDFPGAMESCTNTGVVEFRDSDIFVTTLIRSGSPAKKYYLHDKIAMLCEVLGARHGIGRDLPHWENNVDDSLLAKLRQVYPDKEPAYGQGTTECGIFCANLPGAAVIGLGAPFYDAHSPNEHIFISEADESYRRLRRFLALLR